MGSLVDDPVGDHENDVHSSRPSSNSSRRELLAPVNDSWRLCMEHEWISLYMRLGLFPEEACAVQRPTRRSLLHELVVMMMVREQSVRSAGELSAVIDHHENDHGDGDEGHDYANVSTCNNNTSVPTFILRSIYFSCPQAMMLQDSLMGYTPLHCALASSTTPSSTSLIDIERHQQQKEESSTPSPSPDVVICTLLELSQGISSYCDGGTDNNYYLFDNEKDDVTSIASDISTTTSSRMIVTDNNEEMVLLLQDHSGDTPLHTACRHGCNKRIFLALMEACPSALLIYNYDGMTPLRLLWYAVRTSFQTTTTTTRSSSTSSSTNEDHSFYTEVEMIVHEKIHTYQDLRKFPLFKDAWEKTLICLYILATTTPEEEEEDGMRPKKSAPRDVALIMSLLEDDGDAVHEPPELPFQILHSIASTDCDGMAMELALKFYPDEPPDEDGRSVLDVAIARQAMMEQENDLEGGGTTTHKTIADVLMKYNYGIQAATVKDLTSGISPTGRTHNATTTNKNSSSSITQQKRSLLHMMEQSTSSSSNSSSYSSSLELKGVEPDEHGMLPMPSPEQLALLRSKKIKSSPRRRHKKPSTKDGDDQILSSSHDQGISETRCQEEQEETNLFFDSG